MPQEIKVPLIEQLGPKMRQIMEEVLLPSIEQLKDTQIGKQIGQKWRQGEQEECVDAIIDGAQEYSQLWEELGMKKSDFYEREKEIIRQELDRIFGDH